MLSSVNSKAYLLKGESCSNLNVQEQGQPVISSSCVCGKSPRLVYKIFYFQEAGVGLHRHMKKYHYNFCPLSCSFFISFHQFF